MSGRRAKFLVASLVFVCIGLAVGLGVGLGLEPRNCATASFNSEDPMERANDMLTICPLIDTHNDLPWAIRSVYVDQVWRANLTEEVTPFHTSIPLIKKGHLGGQIWSVYASCASMDKDAVRVTQEQIDVVYQLEQRYPDFFSVATTADELEEKLSQGLFPSLMGMEGGHQIDNSLASLRSFRRQGVRYMTLTHNCDTIWSQSCCPGVYNRSNVTGLTEFGRAVVKEMNRIGMLVDLSHTSVQTMRDALDTTVAPVMFSHSNSYTLCPTGRNVPDEILKRLVVNGGAVCVTFVPGFVNCTNSSSASVSQVADHIEYIVSIASYDNVCLGGDFDGISETITNLGNVSTYPNLIAELYRRSWSDENIKKLIGGNVIRLLRVSEEISEQLHAEIPGQEVLNDITVSTGCRLTYG